jgi:hypothetical protein
MITLLIVLAVTSSTAISALVIDVSFIGGVATINILPQHHIDEYFGKLL